MATNPIGEWRETGTLLRGEWQVHQEQIVGRLRVANR
jgi:hypothetical protein